MSRLEPPRHRNLIKTIYRERSRRIVEVDVHEGFRAMRMIETAALRHPPSTIEYFGFDLFEEERMDELRRAEFTGRPAAVQRVLDRLNRTGARVRLFQGDTRTTLRPAFAEIGVPDLVLIGGGYAVANFASDWKATQAAMGPKTTVMFDNYHVDSGPELEGVGCQAVVDVLDPEEFEVEHLKPADRFQESSGTRLVTMVRVRRRS